MRNFTLLGLLFCVFLSALGTGCTEETAKKDTDGKIPVVGVLVYNRNDVFITSVTEAIQKDLQGKADVQVQYGESDQVIQNEQIYKLVDKKVDALLINLVDPQRASEALALVQKASIPAIFFNREPDLDVLKRYTKTAFVGTDASEAGIMQGDIIAQLWKQNPAYDRNKDGVFQYIMLQGNSDSAEAILRTQTSVSEAEAKGVPMRQLGETLVCNWDRVQGQQAMRLALDAFGEHLELIISNNDSMALGALDILHEHGYNSNDASKFIPIIGVDAITEACKAIREGRMSATVMQDAQGMADAVVGMMLNALRNKDLLEGLPFHWDTSGIAIRIPYKPYLP